MTTLYQKTQFGLASVLFMGAIAGFIYFMGWITDEPRSWALATVGLVVLVSVPLSSMTIRITPSTVEWWFAFGIAHQRLAISELRGARVLRTTLLSGLGVHWSGSNVLWAVSGPNAVALELSDERLIGLSTNEPQVVIDVINRLIAPGDTSKPAR